MQVNGIFISRLQVNAVVIVAMVVNNFLVDQQMRETLGVLPYDKACQSKTAMRMRPCATQRPCAAAPAYHGGVWFQCSHLWRRPGF